MLHLIPAADGCAVAREQNAVAIVVDTLRASTTVTMLLAQASEVIVVREVEDARTLAASYPQALLVGERQGLPPPGFHLGNSPVAARDFDCRGRTIIFTSTTGSARAVGVVGNSEKEGPPLFMGAPVNARAVARAARKAALSGGGDVVVIPAGHVSDDHHAGPEDTAGATVIGLELQALGLVPAADVAWAFDPQPADQIPSRAAECIHSSPHARSLQALGPEFAADVDFCCRLNRTDVVPGGVDTVALPRGEKGVVFAAWEK